GAGDSVPLPGAAPVATGLARGAAERLRLGQHRPAIQAARHGLGQAGGRGGRKVADLHPELVDIPACFAWDKGVWYQVREGVRGILVWDGEERACVYMLTEQASHYYQVMTRNERMPVFLGRRI